MACQTRPRSTSTVRRSGSRRQARSKWVAASGEFAALLGQGGEFEVRAEVIAAEFDGLLPARDAGGQRVVDVVEGAFGGGVAVAAQAVEDAARFGLLASFVAEEGVLEGGGGVLGVEAHGFAELVAGQFGLAGFEVGVGEIFADVGARGGGGSGGEEGGDGDVVVVGAQGGVGAFQLLEGRVLWLGGRQHGRNGEDYEGPHTTEIRSGGGWESSPGNFGRAGDRGVRYPDVCPRQGVRYTR